MRHNFLLVQRTIMKEFEIKDVYLVDGSDAYVLYLVNVVFFYLFKNTKRSVPTQKQFLPGMKIVTCNEYKTLNCRVRQ